MPAIGSLHDVWPGPVTDLAINILEQPGEALLLDLDADASRVRPRPSSRPTSPACSPCWTRSPPRRGHGCRDVALVPDEAGLLDLGTAPRRTEDVTWPAAFERQARRTPDAVALVCEHAVADRTPS